jgi:hypothetical protein
VLRLTSIPASGYSQVKLWGTKRLLKWSTSSTGFPASTTIRLGS